MEIRFPLSPKCFYLKMHCILNIRFDNSNAIDLTEVILLLCGVNVEVLPKKANTGLFGIEVILLYA